MFMSSNVYYDYVPVVNTTTLSPTTSVINNDSNNNSAAMEVEDDSTKRQQKRFHENQNPKRKRCSLKDDLVPGYTHDFKRSRGEAVLTNVLSMVQEKCNGCHRVQQQQQQQQSPKTADYSRCMSRFYA